MMADFFAGINGRKYEFLDGEKKGLGFSLVNRLGPGSAGEVWRVNVADGTSGALKVYSSTLEKPQQMRQFQTEASISLNRLWFVPPIGSGKIGERDNRSAILFPFIEPSEDLSDFVTTGNPDQDTRLEIALQLTSSIIELHNDGWLHNDIKAKNVLHCPEDEMPIRLIDYQFTCPIDKVDDIYGDMERHIGTRGYMSPETFSAAKNITISSDIWALGCTLYHIFTGREVVDRLEWIVDREPFIKRCLEDMSEPLLSPEVLLKEGIPEELCRPLSQMLSPKMNIRNSDLLVDFMASIDPTSVVDPDDISDVEVDLTARPPPLVDSEIIRVVIHPNGKPRQFVMCRKDETKHVISHHFDGIIFPNRKLMTMRWDGEYLVCSGRSYVTMEGESIRSRSLGPESMILFNGLPTRILCQSTNP